MTPQILIAGTHSGVGKTTITMGLIAALKRRGLAVQPFKAGPDYIDPTYHTLAAGRPCRNIDTWMVPPDRAVTFFTKAARSADIAVIEGVMGLFDSFSYDSEEGSSAQIAKLVNAPVLLVLDVGKMARSVGAIATGYTNFDSNLTIAGFILNRCGSEGHYQGVKSVVERTTHLPVVGWLPKDAELHIPERHLGLVPTDERGELTTFIAHAAAVIEQYVDLEQILKIAGSQMSVVSSQQSVVSSQQSVASSQQSVVSSQQSVVSSQQAVVSSQKLSITNYQSKIVNRKSKICIAVARDATFSFYYEDNLDLLRDSGAEIIFFSPLTDTGLPPNTAGIYLGGGFPEMFAAQLAANTPMFGSLRQAHRANIPIYAECGGFMVLTQAIIDLEGQRHPMVGLIPGEAHMQPRLMSLGYRVVESPTGNFLLPQGVTTRGHEFHWSRWTHPANSPAWLIRPRQGSGAPQPNGYAAGNLIASYVHLHFAHNPQLAHNFAQACRMWLEKRETFDKD
jgi:cobyrinic acid a,c-diamide synthase